MKNVIPVVALLVACAASTATAADVPGGETIICDFDDPATLDDFVESPVGGVVRYPQSPDPGVAGKPGLLLSKNRGTQGQALHLAIGCCNIVEQPVTLSVKMR